MATSSFVLLLDKSCLDAIVCLGCAFTFKNESCDRMLGACYYVTCEKVHIFLCFTCLDQVLT